jgi:hypothetical protein
MSMAAYRRPRDAMIEVDKAFSMASSPGSGVARVPLPIPLSFPCQFRYRGGAAGSVVRP